MVFADRLPQRFVENEFTSALHELFRDARMVQVHDDVVEQALELAERDEEKLKNISKFVVWPDYDTWMEFRLDGKDVGIYFHGDNGQSVTRGHGLIIMDFRDGREPHFVPISVDLPKYHLSFCDTKSLAMMKADELGVDHQTRKLFGLIEPSDTYSIDPIAEAVRMAPFTSAVKKLLLTLLAFMNSPKLIRKRECTMEKFNARRLKRGKYPYHPHHEVRLNIDKHVLNVTRGQGDGPERCLHFVRAHLRYLVHPRYKNVSVVLVPPHTRGNPALGITDASYAVDRENSKWTEQVERP